MAYSRVERQVWDDERFRVWPRDTRDAWLYILTCRHQNRIGMFVLDPMFVAADVQISIDSARESIERLEAEDRIMYDRSTRLMLVLRHLKHNPLANPNVAKAAALELLEQPFAKRLWERFLKAVDKYVPATTEKGEPFGSIICDAARSKLADLASNPVPSNDLNGSGNGLPNGYPNGMANPDPEPEQDPEQELEAGRAGAPADQPATTDVAAQPDETGPLTPVANVEAQASEIIRAANRGMVQNDSIDADRFRPIGGSHGSRSYVLEWLQAGIPFDLICETVAARAAAYQPSDTRKQISTMKYFDSAVRDEWERRQALPPPGSQAATIRDEYPGNGRGGSTAGPVRIDGYDPEREERERQDREARAIAKWCRDHPSEAADVRKRLEVTLKAEPKLSGLPERTVQTIIEGRIREEIWQRMQAST